MEEGIRIYVGFGKENIYKIIQNLEKDKFGLTPKWNTHPITRVNQEDI